MGMKVDLDGRENGLKSRESLQGVLKKRNKGGVFGGK